MNTLMLAQSCLDKLKKILQMPLRLSDWLNIVTISQELKFRAFYQARKISNIPFVLVFLTNQIAGFFRKTVMIFYMRKCIRVRKENGAPVLEGYANACPDIPQ